MELSEINYHPVFFQASPVFLSWKLDKYDFKDHCFILAKKLELLHFTDVRYPFREDFLLNY